MKTSEVIRERLYEWYRQLLLEDRIRISAVPVFLRLDHNCGGSLYVVAFRIDRGLRDKKRYQQDWILLETDIQRAKDRGWQSAVDGLNSAKEFQIAMLDGDLDLQACLFDRNFNIME